MSESRNKRINHIKSLPKYTKSNLGRYSVPPETNRLKERTQIYFNLFTILHRSKPSPLKFC